MKNTREIDFSWKNLEKQKKNIKTNKKTLKPTKKTSKKESRVLISRSMLYKLHSKQTISRGFRFVFNFVCKQCESDQTKRSSCSVGLRNVSGELTWSAISSFQICYHISWVNTRCELSSVTETNNECSQLVWKKFFLLKITGMFKILTEIQNKI